MKFRFDVNTGEKDYVEFNKFVLLRSHYGKNQIVSLRIMLAIIFLIFAIAGLCEEGLTWDFAMLVIPLMILLVLSQVFFKRIFALSIKSTINGFKKRGKMGFEPTSVLEFYDDCFIEIAPEKKTELKYSLVERISVDDNKYIYLHINNAVAYILPISCFESEEQKNSFLEFIKTKCDIVDVY